MPELKCKHCGERIVETKDWAGRLGWTHQPAGAAFQDGQHRHCHLRTAFPTTTCGHVKIERPYLDQGSTFEMNGGQCVLQPGHKEDHDYRLWAV